MLVISDLSFTRVISESITESGIMLSASHLIVNANGTTGSIDVTPPCIDVMLECIIIVNEPNYVGNYM